MKLTHISLFSGIGGIDLAAEWAGFETVLFVEIDKYCQKVLRKHWPDVPIIGDIKDVKGTDYSATLVTGGFPCQPVSTAGQRKGEEDNRWLWPEMLRVISEVRPAWVVAENVAGLLTMGISNLLSEVESRGYGVQTYVIPACALNAPHRRDRIFIVAHTKSFNGKGSVSTKSYGEKSQEQPRGLLSNNGWQNWQDNLSTPLTCGKNDGIPYRVDRLKCLGNAVVPQQIYPILKAIARIENETNTH